MSVCMGEVSSTPYAHLCNAKPSSVTTYRVAINQIQKKIKNASLRDVHLYEFNIHPDQLYSAISLLHRGNEGKHMRVTYSEEYNFIVKYMPGAAHERAHSFWLTFLIVALAQLIAPMHHDIGCLSYGSITSHLGPSKRVKEPDAGIVPVINPSGLPSIVMEVGSSETLSQLRLDAKYWLEDSDQIILVIIISIDCPRPPFPNFPRIRIELWRASPNNRLTCQATLYNRMRVATSVWGADWTEGPTPFYILLSDIFRGQPPAAYGNHDRVYLDAGAWREAIISNY